MKKVFFIFLSSVCTCAGWVQAQIEADLTAFPKKSVTQDALRKTMKNTRIANWHSDVALVEIRGGVMRVLGRVSAGFDALYGRLDTVVREVNRWQSEAPIDRRLPDTLMLLSCGDGLDVASCKGFVYPDELKVPLFVFSKRISSNKLVLIPDTGAMTQRYGIIQEIKKGCRSFPWDKKEGVLFWRGAGTEGEYSLAAWKDFPRAKLTLFSIKNPQLVDAGFTALPQVVGPDAMDDILKYVGSLKEVISVHDHLRYKYLMDIDGNSNGWDRCYWGLLSNSALFKQVTDFNQWYYKALEPWEHYIPVKADLSDLQERLNWAKSHDDQARKIAEEGQKIAQDIFSREAVFGYIRQLLEAYNERVSD